VLVSTSCAAENRSQLLITSNGIVGVHGTDLMTRRAVNNPCHPTRSFSKFLKKIPVM